MYLNRHKYTTILVQFHVKPGHEMYLNAATGAEGNKGYIRLNQDMRCI